MTVLAGCAADAWRRGTTVAGPGCPPYLGFVPRRLRGSDAGFGVAAMRGQALLAAPRHGLAWQSSFLTLAPSASFTRKPIAWLMGFLKATEWNPLWCHARGYALAACTPLPSHLLANCGQAPVMALSLLARAEM